MDTRTHGTDLTGSHPPSPPPSARVRLEVDILVSEPGAPNPPIAPVRDDSCRVVLVVSADGDVRRYIRESLCDRVDLRVLEASTVHDARRISEHTAVSLVITDIPATHGFAPPPRVPAILITDESSDGMPPAAECVAVPGPFTAERLAGVVARLLG